MGYGGNTGNNFGVIYRDDRVTIEAFPVSHGTLETHGLNLRRRGRDRWGYRAA
ncbi:MAG: hypothetical protein ACLTFJ_14190 [Clostridium sp.]